MMDRRRFLLTSLAGAFAVSLAAEAQQAAKVWRVGLLSGGGPTPAFLDELRQGLRDHGYAEGRNLVIEFRFAHGKQDSLPGLAADLAGLPVDAIVAIGSPSALAAYRATRTIPIVLLTVGDPIGLGLALSLSRPGGNVTGTASYGPELAAKTLQVLKEIVPGIKRVALGWNPANPLRPRVMKDLEAPARLLDVQLYGLKITSPDDFEPALPRAMAERLQAVWFFGDALFFGERARLATMALGFRLPTMFLQRQHVDAGGLVSYGPAVGPMYRRAAAYVDKILRGDKLAPRPHDPALRAGASGSGD